jgi:DNA-binding NtrC family response regulator
VHDRTIEASRRVEVRGGSLRVVGAAGRKASSTVAVGLSPVTIGRGAECHLSISDPKVSTIHVELLGTPEGTRIEDKGSRNGTFIGGARVAAGYLVDATKIVIGDTTLMFTPARPTQVALGKATSFGPIIGSSGSMRLVFERISRGAETDLTALVTGETGSGKELVAQALHEASPRRRGPFVIVDCGAISPGLAEATLFGHERGAFTGAIERRRSPFIEANGGTVFLDEIGELPLELQPKLLRVLAERRIKPVGSNTYEDIDVRIVAATRRDLTAAVNEGSFRSDLYFRLAELRIEVPPLRARPEDIPLLLGSFFADLGHPNALARIPEAAMDRLLRHEWPGNIRELKSAATAAIALAEPGDPVDPSIHLGPTGLRSEAAELDGLSYREARNAVLSRFEATYFARLVADTNGNIAEIARRTGLARIHVRKYVLRHSLAPARPAAGGRRRKAKDDG